MPSPKVPKYLMVSLVVDLLVYPNLILLSCLFRMPVKLILKLQHVGVIGPLAYISNK